MNKISNSSGQVKALEKAFTAIENILSVISDMEFNAGDYEAVSEIINDFAANRNLDNILHHINKKVKNDGVNYIINSVVVGDNNVKTGGEKSPSKTTTTTTAATQSKKWVKQRKDSDPDLMYLTREFIRSIEMSGNGQA